MAYGVEALFAGVMDLIINIPTLLYSTFYSSRPTFTWRDNRKSLQKLLAKVNMSTYAKTMLLSFIPPKYFSVQFWVQFYEQKLTHHCVVLYISLDKTRRLQTRGTKLQESRKMSCWEMVHPFIHCMFISTNTLPKLSSARISKKGRKAIKYIC